jgi:ABC-type amino acid transport system permease subunit
VATLSTLVFVGLIVLVVVNASGWPDVKQAFFDPDVFRESFPDIARAFLINVRIFLIAEVFILVFALVIALMRGLPGPVLFPLRALATIYSDFFRGIPTILLVYILSCTRRTCPRSTARGSSRCIRARRRRHARSDSAGSRPCATSFSRRLCGA